MIVSTATTDPEVDALPPSVVPVEQRFMSHALWQQDAGYGPRNLFLTGMAGTGKSTLIGKFLELNKRRVAITASTGIAAVNIGGMTVHRWSGMMLGPREGQSNADCFRELTNSKYWRPWIAARIRRTDVLIIDEVSMLTGRALDYLDYHMRMVRDDPAPFGGVQVILTGDFLQLPPVSRTGNYDWAFNAQVWQTAEIKTFELETVHRQSDPDFIRVLTAFRKGVISKDGMRLLYPRVAKHPSRSLVRLVTHNAQVDKWNQFCLEDIDEPAVTYRARESGQGTDEHFAFLRKNVRAPEELVLKEGAMVICVANIRSEEKDADGGAKMALANGTRGVVKAMEPDAVTILTENNQVHRVERHSWSYDPFDDTSATYSQIPLRLAYALTIHKSQGMTLSSAYIDIRAARDPGQAYVAISRVRTLDGLHLKSWFNGVFVSPDALAFYERNRES